MSKINSKHSIWLTWHYAARSRNMTKVLDIPIFEYFNNKNALLRHSLSSLWTIGVLFRRRPKVVFIQLSFMLLNIVVLYKILNFGKTIVVVDCHTKALRRKASGPLNFIFWPIKVATFKFVNISIVSNIGMEKDIKELHKDYFIIPDKIPELKPQNQSEAEKYGVYISSFAVDEPYNEIFEVAELLGDEIKLYWTGKKPAHYKLPDNLPSNIIFTGYLSFDDYYNLIGNANCILALTTEEDCLQSGAYEALAVETPMVLSNTKALREYFADSAIYTSHKPVDIADNIKKAFLSTEKLKENITKIKKIRNTEFTNQIKKLKEYIS